MPNNFFQNIKNAASTALSAVGITINDDRGNALNVPINQQKPKGIYRTFLPSGNVSDVMVKIKSDVNYPKGFTPEEAYYIKGTQSSALNDKTGLPIEQGNVNTNMAAKNNSSIDKISRTWMEWKPTDASPQDRSGNLPSYNDTTLTLLNQGPAGKDNKYNSVGGPIVQKGWTDPYFYITDFTSNESIGLTGIPKQFGINPQNINPNWNKKSPVYTTPDRMLHGEKGEIIGDKIVTGNIAGAEEVFDFFDNNQQYLFSHKLDKIIPDSGLENPANFKECYIGSTLKTTVTSVDNEDPVIFGYDIIIKYDSSPLFNGAIVDFINNFNNESEISPRKDIWLKFCTQFFKFFKSDQISKSSEYQNSNYSSGTPPTTEQSNSSRDINSQIGNMEQERLINIPNDASNINTTIDENKRGNSVGNMAKNKTLDEVVVGPKSTKKIPRTYYLKKISGLDNLVEKEVTSNSDTVKSMVDYGKDIIKLSLYDDVTISTGYLSTLYKMMSWSRLNGKQIIPENLLRFDAKIVITEIRDFNRVVHVMATQSTNKTLDVLADSTNKYTYTLYDCQFLFNKLSHGDDIDMSSPKQLDDFDIAFNYKYSTLSFDKFNFGNNDGIKRHYNFLNNKKINPQEIGPEESNINVGGDSVKYDIKPTPINGYKKIGNNNVSQPSSQLDKFSKSYDDSISKSYKNKWERFISSEEPILEVAKRNDINKKLMDQLGNKLKRAAANEINRQITTQAKLLNRTLDNIRNSIGIGRMSEPTNVYKTNQLKNDVQNAFREFVGNSVRGFFTP